MIGNKMIKCRFLKLRFCLGYDMGKGKHFFGWYRIFKRSFMKHDEF